MTKLHSAAEERPQRFLIRYQCGAGGDMEAQADQLSEKGLFIHTESASPVNSLVTLQLTLPGSTGLPIRATATVVYSNPFRPFVPSALPPGMGVKFTVLTDNDRERIFGYVNALQPGGQELIKVDLGNRPQRRVAAPPEHAAAPVDAFNAAAEAALGGGDSKDRPSKAKSARGAKPSRAGEAVDDPLWQRLWKRLNQPVGANPASSTKEKGAKSSKPSRPKGKS